MIWFGARIVINPQLVDFSDVLPRNVTGLGLPPGMVFSAGSQTTERVVANRLAATRVRTGNVLVIAGEDTRGDDGNKSGFREDNWIATKSRAVAQRKLRGL